MLKEWKKCVWKMSQSQLMTKILFAQENPTKKRGKCGIARVSGRMCVCVCTWGEIGTRFDYYVFNSFFSGFTRMLRPISIDSHRREGKKNWMRNRKTHRKSLIISELTVKMEYFGVCLCVCGVFFPFLWILSRKTSTWVLRAKCAYLFIAINK